MHLLYAGARIEAFNPSGFIPEKIFSNFKCGTYGKTVSYK